MFGTSGIRGRVGAEVTADLALAVGRAVASMGAERIVVGRDPRASGELLRDALASGARECGTEVVDLGVAATPTIARAVGWRDADAGVAITASHNPAPDNGIKLWTPSGQAFDADRRDRVADRVRNDRFDLAAWDGLGGHRTDDAVDDHVAAITDSVASIEDCRVLVDVGNGAGQVTVAALEELGCAVETLNAQPDGRFPGRPSEPTAEHCTTLQAVVGNTDADLGIAHDGDADRMRAVDETGEFVSGDVLLALFGRAAASRGDTVVVPVDTSLAVDDALEAVGAAVERTKVGDVHVAERAAETGAAFGGEPSGAWIWPDETLCPDGPLAACRLASLVDRGPSLRAQCADIPTYPIRRENVDCEAKAERMEQVRTRAAGEYADDAVSTIDGVRVETDEGWFLVRASGTEPVIRITAEGRSAEATDDLLSAARALVAA